MKNFLIPDEDGKGFTRIQDGEEVEYVNPIQYYADSYINMVMLEDKDLLRLKNPFLESFLTEEFYAKRAQESWNEIFGEYMAVEIPENFLKLLDAPTKKDQIRLLRGQSLNTEIWFAFIVKAWETYGCTFSNYKFEGLPGNVKDADLPALIHDGEELRVVGETALSPGQLKNIILQRTVIVAKILDIKDSWHCFFCTYRSLRGEESWDSGQPHWHYISDKWGISRNDLIEAIKMGRHPSTSVHIAFQG